MRYLDTSLLVPLFIQEPKSADAGTWLVGIDSADLAVSPWGVTEFSSAASIKTRTGQIDTVMRAKIHAEFLVFLTSRVRRVTPVVSADFQRAAELCDRWSIGLRAGDALHLAIAERRGMTVCTLDKGMWTAAQALGIPFETF
jgi:predicted nucleic acid-binding protein